ncbi:MAG: prolyl oligopeptidase family serine peptidase [Flavobacteriales bacterium]|jgi:polyhydroxybutyrate depolymerase|nr:prolyl oligopeptidase family serine peptidase [Flavobacteriales bacterium]MDP4730968.1 prolyl oligopeptidase family serine peptidase [Flavobacteriales bacterium]MDP4818713.1 prolyl oligopeptidase family serine peptidase [Flavobacteriales bacterium]MDP4951803.1 prolyl oligopeptidase family serine peptidase [Flavobacteriales bacterium]MDP5074889.1 prolyl oligopeptidase family serine peptidase [Flavobacteriales bacterium]
MRTSILALFFLLLIHAGKSQTTFSFDYNGTTREYILYTPSNMPIGNRPLVFNFHGYTNNMSFQMGYSEMNAVADVGKFYVVYPQGLPDANGINHWNAWQDPADVDDIGYINALLDYLLATESVDYQRVYSCGFSNGGIFSYALAGQLSDRFAAIASVAGTMTEVMIQNTNPTRPVPTFHIHGTLDPVVPYDGSLGQYPTFGVLTSVSETLNFWKTEDDCSSTSTNNIANSNLFDFCTASKTIYSGCAEHDNWYIEISGGGHTWPGTTPLTVTGATCQDFDGSQEIWNFFSAITMPPMSVEENTNGKNVVPVAYYDLQGRVIEKTELCQGIYIVRMSDGSAKKIKRE